MFVILSWYTVASISAISLASALLPQLTLSTLLLWLWSSSPNTIALLVSTQGSGILAKTVSSSVDLLAATDLLLLFLAASLSAFSFNRLLANTACFLCDTLLWSLM